MVKYCKVLVADFVIDELKAKPEYIQVIPVGAGFSGPVIGIINGWA